MFNKKKKEQENLINEKVDATDTAVEHNEGEEQKEKKPHKVFKMWDAFNGYKFTIEIIAAILLITLGVLILVFKDEAKFAIFIITGGVPLFALIIRAIIFMKKHKEFDKKYKYMFLVEAIVDILLCGALIFAAFATVKAQDEDAAEFFVKSRDFFNKNYPYFAAGILYITSMTYFIRTIIYKLYTDKFRFWLNATLITGAVVLCAFKDELTAWVIAIIIAVLAFLSAAVVGTDAGGGYYNYYKRSKAKEIEEKKEEVAPLEAPTTSDKEDIDYSDIDPNAIPEGDTNDTTDEIIS